MAAVDKIEDKRKPEEYICHRNRKNLSMPCRKTNCRFLRKPSFLVPPRKEAKNAA